MGKITRIQVYMASKHLEVWAAAHIFQALEVVSDLPWLRSWLPLYPVPIRSVEESFNMSDESGVPSLGVARKKKIAIGVIFMLSPNPEENSRFQDFFFSHFPLFESHMNKLKSAIEQVT